MGLRFGKDSADQEKNLGFSRLDTCSIAINNETSALPGSGGHSEQITICSSVAAYVQAFRYFQKIHRRLNQGMVEPNFKLAGGCGWLQNPHPNSQPRCCTIPVTISRKLLYVDMDHISNMVHYKITFLVFY